jgi:type IV pilus assembly protein PilF
MRLLVAALVLVVTAGCTSSTTSKSGQVTDNTAVDGRRRAEVHTMLAGEYYQRGNYGVALAETRLAIKDDPTYFGAYSMQGLVLMELREDGPARDAFGRALQLAPNNPDVLNNYGWFLCLRNETQRGMDMMRKAASDTLYSSPEKAWYSMGLCQRRAGKAPEAEEALRRAIMIRPDMIGALYNLAVVTYERGNYKDAEVYLSRYTRLATPNLEGLVLGVRVARALNDRAAEESFLQQMRRRFPDAPELRELEKR